jgi:hypothetical protein
LTTKPVLKRILEGILHTDEEKRCSQKNARKNKSHQPSRVANKE